MSGCEVIIINIKKILFKLAALFCIYNIFTGSIALAEGDIFTDTQDKLDNITKEEKDTLEELYKLEQDIQGLEQKEITISNDINNSQNAIHELNVNIEAEINTYEKHKANLKEVLRSYQRMGPNTFLEILLNSDSLTDFIDRITTLREITRKTGELMDKLDESQQKLKKQKAELTDKIEALTTEQSTLSETISDKKQLKDRQEAYLNSLEEDKSKYETYLDEITEKWEALLPVFAETTKGFAKLVESGSLPPEALKLSFESSGVLGTVKEEAFNEIISAHPELPKMIFTFNQGEVVLSIPDNNLVLTGNFTIENEQILKFNVEKGSFYDMPLEESSIQELSQKGEFILDLRPLLGKSTLNSVTIEKGEIVLDIKLKLF